MKLNLHLHTKYSDGNSTILEMANVCKEQDHVALVISDHDYCMDPKSYRKQCSEAKNLSGEIGYPIICGLEISLYYEEAVLIGQAACLAWLYFRKKHRSKNWDEIYRFAPGVDAIKKVLHPFNYGLCLVHPGAHGPKELYEIFHCHEIMNAGHEWPRDAQDKLLGLAPQSKPVRGIDAHSTLWFSKEHRCQCNEVEPGEWDEEKIIEWMKGKKYEVPLSVD